MKKILEPLKIEIYYFDEQDVLTESFDEAKDKNEGDMAPTIFYD